MDLPRLETPVIVTMDDGTEFLAMRIIVCDGRRDHWAWATVDEWEPKAPLCWTDGVCWASNDEGKASRQPARWRNV